jgi:hypothetical protein
MIALLRLQEEVAYQRQRETSGTRINAKPYCSTFENPRGIISAENQI